MKKEILIALDDSIHSRQAVHYAASMSSMVGDLSYTLFHIQPVISQYIIEEAEKDAVANAKLSALVKSNNKNARTLLDKFKSQMKDAGIDPGCIKIQTMPRMSGLAKDILDYAVAGQYDAIVVGRRGVSKVQEMLMGSVTGKLLEHSKVIPVWVIDDKVGASDIVVAVDGSESSLRAVDHVGFMLKDNTDATITLLHVKPRFGQFSAIDFNIDDQALDELLIKGDRHRIDNFFGDPFAKKVLLGIAAHVNKGKNRN